MIVIVDYGLGNLASVKNMIKKVGGRSIISSDPDEISSAEKLVLPGVGSFGTGMANIKERGIDEALKIAVVENKVPLLG
ncbi:MAG: imidazole glycerol phosphate synthase subunit HisH, partial [Flavobacteriales bacterium]|nr:imidazole glycerol phosphate synthase subunit HisH [Flavobacteriales bacterium]